MCMVTFKLLISLSVSDCVVVFVRRDLVCDHLPPEGSHRPSPRPSPCGATILLLQAARSVVVVEAGGRSVLNTHTVIVIPNHVPHITATPPPTLPHFYCYPALPYCDPTLQYCYPTLTYCYPASYTTPLIRLPNITLLLPSPPLLLHHPNATATQHYHTAAQPHTLPHFYCYPTLPYC